LIAGFSIMPAISFNRADPLHCKTDIPSCMGSGKLPKRRRKKAEAGETAQPTARYPSMNRPARKGVWGLPGWSPAALQNKRAVPAAPACFRSPLLYTAKGAKDDYSFRNSKRILWFYAIPPRHRGRLSALVAEIRAAGKGLYSS